MPAGHPGEAHSRTFPAPGPLDDPRVLFPRYLDFYRASVADKLLGLDETHLRSSRLPSGWTPLELVKHLAFMERRWVVWGFLGEDVADPWGDERDGRWYVPPGETLASLLTLLHQGGARTTAVIETHPLSAPAAPGGRFSHGTELPSLAAILFHLLQEYARHTGHLDVVRELADGHTGE